MSYNFNQTFLTQDLINHHLEFWQELFNHPIKVVSWKHNNVLMHTVKTSLYLQTSSYPVSQINHMDKFLNQHFHDKESQFQVYNWNSLIRSIIQNSQLEVMLQNLHDLEKCFTTRLKAHQNYDQIRKEIKNYDLPVFITNIHKQKELLTFCEQPNKQILIQNFLHIKQTFPNLFNQSKQEQKNTNQFLLILEQHFMKQLVKQKLSHKNSIL